MTADVMELLARADPVRDEDLRSRVEAARPRVMRGAREPHRRPLLRAALPALAATAVAAALLLALVLPGDGDTSALAIERSDGYIELRIKDPSADAARMNRELRERGIDLRIETVPVRPEDVGHWAGGRAVWPGVPEDADQHRLGDERIRELNDAARGKELVMSPGDPSVIRVPSAWEGHWLLYAGRDARPGEEPWINGNAPGAY
jgi:hypothetical protein